MDFQRSIASHRVLRRNGVRRKDRGNGRLDIYRRGANVVSSTLFLEGSFDLETFLAQRLSDGLVFGELGKAARHKI